MTSTHKATDSLTIYMHIWPNYAFVSPTMGTVSISSTHTFIPQILIVSISLYIGKISNVIQTKLKEVQAAKLEITATNNYINQNTKRTINLNRDC
jgi:hypothetical protein